MRIGPFVPRASGRRASARVGAVVLVGLLLGGCLGGPTGEDDGQADVPQVRVDARDRSCPLQAPESPEWIRVRIDLFARNAGSEEHFDFANGTIIPLLDGKWHDNVSVSPAGCALVDIPQNVSKAQFHSRLPTTSAYCYYQDVSGLEDPSNTTYHVAHHLRLVCQ